MGSGRGRGRQTKRASPPCQGSAGPRERPADGGAEENADCRTSDRIFARGTCGRVRVSRPTGDKKASAVGDREGRPYEGYKGCGARRIRIAVGAGCSRNEMILGKDAVYWALRIAAANLRTGGAMTGFRFLPPRRKIPGVVFSLISRPFFPGPPPTIGETKEGFA